MSGIPLRHLVSEIDERTGNSGPLLSVSIHSGVYRRDDVNRDAPRADTLENYKRCRSGDLVLNRMRAFQGALGVAPVDGIVSPDYAVLRASPGVDMRFVAYALRSAWGVAEMVSRLRGIGGVSSGVVRTPRINVSDLLEIRLRPLDRPAQTAVADMLDRECQRIAALRSAMSRHSSQLDALRSACVREATATLHQVPLKYCASVIDCKHRTAAYLDRGFPLISTREELVVRCTSTKKQGVSDPPISLTCGMGAETHAVATSSTAATHPSASRRTCPRTWRFAWARMSCSSPDVLVTANC